MEYLPILIAGIVGYFIGSMFTIMAVMFFINRREASIRSFEEKRNSMNGKRQNY